jgi:hypothetical protein
VAVASSAARADATKYYFWAKVGYYCNFLNFRDNWEKEYLL